MRYLGGGGLSSFRAFQIWVLRSSKCTFRGRETCRVRGQSTPTTPFLPFYYTNQQKPPAVAALPCCTCGHHRCLRTPGCSCGQGGLTGTRCNWNQSQQRLRLKSPTLIPYHPFMGIGAEIHLMGVGSRYIKQVGVRSLGRKTV
jgi:hypothetical protein